MEGEIEFLDPAMFDQEWRGMPQNLASLSPPSSTVSQSIMGERHNERERKGPFSAELPFVTEPVND